MTERTRPDRVGAPHPPVRQGEKPWTARQLAAQRAALEAEVERLQAEFAGIEGAIADVVRDGGSGDDQADTGSKAFEREQGMTILASSREALFQTRHALRRLDTGGYGVCEGCGGAVGKARLQAFPRATLCLACKQAAERR